MALHQIDFTPGSLSQIKWLQLQSWMLQQLWWCQQSNNLQEPHQLHPPPLWLSSGMAQQASTYSLPFFHQGWTPVASACHARTIWLTNLLLNLNPNLKLSHCANIDNKALHNIVNHESQQGSLKHVKNQIRWLLKQKENGNLITNLIPSGQMLAYCLTKQESDPPSLSSLLKLYNLSLLDTVVCWEITNLHSWPGHTFPASSSNDNTSNLEILSISSSLLIASSVHAPDQSQPLPPFLPLWLSIHFSVPASSIILLSHSIQSISSTNLISQSALFLSSFPLISLNVVLHKKFETQPNPNSHLVHQHHQ